MIKLNCRSCFHCITNQDCCDIYGDDPSMAVTNCAVDGFRNYQKKPPVGTWIVLNENNEKCALSDDVVREAIRQFMEKYMPHLHGIPEVIK